MVLPRGKYIVLWPEYFDIKRSRKDGRMVSKHSAVERPSVEELAKAVESLGYNFTIEKDTAFPGAWWEGRGRVLVERKTKKSWLLKQVAAILKKNR